MGKGFGETRVYRDGEVDAALVVDAGQIGVIALGDELFDFFQVSFTVSLAREILKASATAAGGFVFRKFVHLLECAVQKIQLAAELPGGVHPTGTR